MKYDVSNHVPTQVELLMLAYQKTPVDVAGMDRALDNIKNLVKDKVFRDKLKAYDKERVELIEKQNQKAVDRTKKLDVFKFFTEWWVNAEAIREEYVGGLELIERNYWNHIKEYITLYLNREFEAEDEQPGDE